jgi:pyruvate ferredoxin oxidoreductase delta subunit
MTEAKKVTAKKKTATRKAAATKPGSAVDKAGHWDIEGIDDWGTSRHELGATIPEAGNSIYNETGGWRTNVPTIDPAKCTGCMLCYFYCPDACGICAAECPVDAITMSVEEKE